MMGVATMNVRRILSGTRAFTMLEVMVVVIIIGILAALVVPRFAGATQEANASALASHVGGVRASIAAFRANAILTGVDPFPTLAQLTTPGVVLQDALPSNPFNRRNTVQAVTRAQAQARVVLNEPAIGWNYFVDNASDPPVAIFYANSDDDAGLGPDGQSTTANQR